MAKMYLFLVYSLLYFYFYYKKKRTENAALDDVPMFNAVRL